MTRPFPPHLLSFFTLFAFPGCALRTPMHPSPAPPPPTTTMIKPTIRPASDATPADARAVVAFWRDAGPGLWFAKDPAFDRRFRERFATDHEAAARGELDAWLRTPDGALALVLLLDQYPRNSFRGTPRMYATDERARRATAAAIAAGHDRAFEPDVRAFFYLPYAHSEDLADQDRAVALCTPLGQPHLSHAIHHRDIIRRFGRFPHRNPILGRPTTLAEQQYLDEGGYRG